MTPNEAINYLSWTADSRLPTYLFERLTNASDLTEAADQLIDLLQFNLIIDPLKPDPPPTRGWYLSEDAGFVDPFPSDINQERG